MSALAFVRCGDGVLGVPGVRGKQCQLVAVLGALECGEQPAWGRARRARVRRAAAWLRAVQRRRAGWARWLR